MTAHPVVVIITVIAMSCLFVLIVIVINRFI